MYLVHARLRLAAEIPLSDALIVARLRRAGRDRGLEHVSVHPATGFGPVLGLFLAADSLDAAERAARAVCLDVLATAPELRGLTLASCEAVAPPGYYEQLASGPD
ncbi:hypothetical protein ACFVXG_16480 [Kitasatospora sp. NPDC058162]|uniref:hypothetical protein n=1 Tax=Kitasatospora sp. NPDC058162 TaxID=3346362 RepID=UPI0036DD48A9